MSTHALVIIGYVLTANWSAGLASACIPSFIIKRPCIQQISAACCEFELEIAQQFNTFKPVRKSVASSLCAYSRICCFSASKSS